MSLRYGLLGMLSKWDATGYDLKKEFDEVMSIFWHSHLSQIYPELNKLEEKEWIMSKRVTQEGRPDKKVYSITTKGKEELMKWLIKPLDLPKIKDPYLMQTFFMDNIPLSEVILHLQLHVKEREERLEKIKDLIKSRWTDIKKRKAIKPRIVLSFAVLKRGLEAEVNYIKWCEDTIQLLEKCSFVWEESDENSSHASFKDFESILIDHLIGDSKDPDTLEWLDIEDV